MLTRRIIKTFGDNLLYLLTDLCCSSLAKSDNVVVSSTKKVNIALTNFALGQTDNVPIRHTRQTNASKYSTVHWCIVMIYFNKWLLNHMYQADTDAFTDFIFDQFDNLPIRQFMFERKIAFTRGQVVLNHLCVYKIRIVGATRAPCNL